MSDSLEQLRELVDRCVRNRELTSVVLSGPRSASDDLRRVTVRPVSIQAELHYQFTSSTDTQQFHRNLTADETAAEILALACSRYRHLKIVAAERNWEARFTKKNKCFLQSTAPVASAILPKSEPIGTAADSHNQRKSYLIPDGTPCPFLVRTGIMTAGGQVRAQHYHKFRQINRYLEFIADVVRNLPESGTLRIVDFGCGKSYLTFAVHYLLTTLFGRPCDIIGLDRRQDVVTTCQRIGGELQLQGLRFLQGDIAGFEPKLPVHLAISLHACDTATDDAIHRAILWKSDVILAVPCCQKELAGHLGCGPIPAMLSHGIVKDRFAALATDSMRAAALNAAGYDAQVIEFIDMEHTAKNLLIRAVRSQNADPAGRSRQAMAQLVGLRELLKVPSLKLESLLRQDRILSEEPDSPRTAP